jgi:hypothetical protein
VAGPSQALWIPFFLAPEDRVEIDGGPAGTIRVTLTGDGTPKGVILRAAGDGAAAGARLLGVEARYLAGGEGAGAPPVRVAGIDALPRDGTGIGSIGLHPPSAPAGEGAAVLVWRRDARAARGDATDAAERLRALGYLGG